MLGLNAFSEHAFASIGQGFYVLVTGNKIAVTNNGAGVVVQEELSLRLQVRRLRSAKMRLVLMLSLVRMFLLQATSSLSLKTQLALPLVSTDLLI